MKKYLAYYENEAGYDWSEIISVCEGEDPFDRAYAQCPVGYHLVYLSNYK